MESGARGVASRRMRSTGIEVDPAGMLSDIHGSAAYRANLVKVMAKRAVAQIASDPGAAESPHAVLTRP